MKLANIAGRMALVVEGGAIDVHDASQGRFGPGAEALYADWDAFRAWAAGARGEARPFADADLGAPSPAPRQVFAIGLNYRSHATETGMEVPAIPAVFTKFPACISGPHDPIELSGEMVDWEVELVVVIGRRADRVGEDQAWDHVAGLCVGQDISDRVVQFAAGAQFSLGKSFRTYGPTGPWLVTPDELADPDDMAIGCAVDGTTVQDDRTSGMVFGVARLVAEISAVVPMLPGDLVFTGTPAGVGLASQPTRFLREGEVLESWVEGIGALTNPVVAQQAPLPDAPPTAPATAPAEGAEGADGAAGAAGEVVREVLGTDVDPPGAPGMTLSLVRYTIPPGAHLAPHLHPGVQLASVVSGRLTYTVVEGTATVRRAGSSTDDLVEGPATTELDPGDAVVEVDGMVHLGANDTGDPVVIEATLLTGDGEDLAVPPDPDRPHRPPA